MRFLENGGGVDDLQTLMGHSNIQMTLRYVQYGREQRAIESQVKCAPSVCWKGGHDVDKKEKGKSRRYTYIGAFVGAGIPAFFQIYALFPVGGLLGAGIGAWFDRRRAREA